MRTKAKIMNKKLLIKRRVKIRIGLRKMKKLEEKREEKQMLIKKLF